MISVALEVVDLVFGGDGKVTILPSQQSGSPFGIFVYRRAFLKVIDRMKTFDMQEKEIVNGVKIVPLLGHTPGSIGVVVETERGPYVRGLFDS